MLRICVLLESKQHNHNYSAFQEHAYIRYLVSIRLSYRIAQCTSVTQNTSNSINLVLFLIKENDNLLNSILLSIYSNTCFMFHYYCYAHRRRVYRWAVDVLCAIRYTAQGLRLLLLTHTHTSSYISLSM